MGLKEKMLSAKNDYKKLNEQYDELFAEITKEIKEKYADFSDKMNFRRALMLHFGAFTKYYDEELGNGLYKISQATNWTKGSDREYLNHYLVMRGSGGRFGWVEEFRTVGFVCYKKHILEAANDLCQKIWLFHIKNSYGRYNESLQTFVNDCKGDKLDFIKIFTEFCDKEYDHKYIFEIVNEPKLKIKDVVIFYQEK